MNKSKLSIVHVVRQYYPCVGGLENFVKSLAETQVGQGNRVRVVTLNESFVDGAEYSERESVNGVDIVRIPFVGSRRYPIAPKVLSCLGEADLVHVHCTDFFSDFLAITRLIHRKPLFLSTHGGFFHTEFASKGKKLFFNVVTRLSMLAYKKIFACSVGDFEKFSTISNRVQLLENGVDVERFSTICTGRDAGVQFLYIGRFSKNKNLPKLIDFFSPILECNLNYKLILVGNDYDGSIAEINRAVASSSANDRIEILGGLSDKQLVEQVERSAFIVSASAYEGFGMTIIEGMAGGLIPIVSGIPSFKRIVESSGVGFVASFDPADKEAAAQYIERALIDRSDLSSKAKEFAEGYSWHEVERSFFCGYSESLGLSQREIQGVVINPWLENEAVSNLKNLLDANKRTYLAFANAHTVNVANADPEYKEILRSFCVLPDGAGVDLASWFKYGRSFPANLNGTDFTPYFLSQVSGLRVFLVGGCHGVAEEAMSIWQERFPQHEWVGAHHGYLNEGDSMLLARRIGELNADLVIVAMGNPLQEKWICKYGEQTGAKLLMGVGALFDFAAGNVKRAPEWIRALRMEWLCRLAQEPKRMWRRYIIGNGIFLFGAVIDRSIK